MTLRTLDELVAKAAELLSASAVEQGSGRVRETPDRRTARYYTTLGLLDRPLEFRGRVGLYGARHLWQLMAIKRLQARGEPLQDIQRRLLNASDAELKRVAAPPAGALEEPTQPRKATRRSFWLEEPAPRAPEEVAPPVATFTGLALTEGVSLTLFAARRAVTPEDVEALSAAAGPLLKVLRARHLI